MPGPRSYASGGLQLLGFGLTVCCDLVLVTKDRPDAPIMLCPDPAAAHQVGCASFGWGLVGVGVGVGAGAW